MNAFELLVPKDKSAALGLLNEHGDEARLIAGGTGLLNLMEQRLVYPERLISLHRVGGMDAVTLDGASVRIGALTRLSTLEGYPAIATHLPMLRETLHEVGPGHRRGGRIGQRGELVPVVFGEIAQPGRFHCRSHELSTTLHVRFMP